MITVEELLGKNDIEFFKLKKNQGYTIYNRWLEIFAKKVKEETGKYTVNGYVWQAYLSGILSSVDGEEGLNQYRNKSIEDYYIIIEQGGAVYECKSGKWPELYLIESIIFPKTESWAMIFSHEETMHYVEPET